MIMLYLQKTANHLSWFIGERYKKMSGSESVKKPAKPAAKRERGKQEPVWTSGLKRLYDSVVDEPLPDSFKELLAKLDIEDSKR